MSSFTQSQWPSWAYGGAVADPFGSYSQLPNYPAYLAESMDAYQAHHSALLNHQMSRATESKPRLSKDEVELLEAEFQKNHKPNSTTKKALAESMRVDNARINNWFQNRRAREKKEKNIREYEAKQKLEKQKAEADGTSMPDDRRRDLVASSAPFPEPRKMSEASSASSPASSAADGVEGLEMAQSDSASIETTPDLLSDSTFAKSDNSTPEDVPDYLSISDASGDMTLSDSESYIPVHKSHDQLFAEYQNMMAQNPNYKAGDFLSSQMFLNNHSQFGNAHLYDRDSSISPTSEHPSDSQLKSPPNIDIASRRNNRRPTPLSINGGRVYTSTGPKTALDMGRMADRASFMRRTSSGSCSGRVSKNVATPRNMFSMNRTPSTGGQSNSTAPPTPNTPLVLNNGLSADMPMPPAFSLEGKFMAGGLIAQDPTLTTPPTTPGVADGLFNPHSAYGMNMSDDNMVNLGHMAGTFGMTPIPPAYVTGHGTTPTEPAYGSQMGSGFFAMYGNNANYNNCE